MSSQNFMELGGSQPWL